jgi:hypothetical protein
MPLSLTDPRWSELQTSYGDDTGDIVAWLAEAQTAGLSEERLGDLINEVQHQGGTSSAMYAVAPHLIALASRADPEAALDLLIHAGMIYANSDQPEAVPCPAFLEEDLSAQAAEGARRLATILLLAVDFNKFKWAVAGLAGHHSFARFLDGLELYEGRFSHDLLDEPFPEEV